MSCKLGGGQGSGQHLVGGRADGGPQRSGDRLPHPGPCTLHPAPSRGFLAQAADPEASRAPASSQEARLSPFLPRVRSYKATW